jgi:hypothetical protein
MDFIRHRLKLQSSVPLQEGIPPWRQPMMTLNVRFVYVGLARI